MSKGQPTSLRKPRSIAVNIPETINEMISTKSLDVRFVTCVLHE